MCPSPLTSSCSSEINVTFDVLPSLRLFPVCSFCSPECVGTVAVNIWICRLMVSLPPELMNISSSLSAQVLFSSPTKLSWAYSWSPRMWSSLMVRFHHTLMSFCIICPQPKWLHVTFCLCSTNSQPFSHDPENRNWDRACSNSNHLTLVVSSLKYDPEVRVLSSCVGRVTFLLSTRGGCSVTPATSHMLKVSRVCSGRDEDQWKRETEGETQMNPQDWTDTKNKYNRTRHRCERRELIG